MKYRVAVQGRIYEVDVDEIAPSKFLVEVNGKKAVIELEEEIKEIKERKEEVSAEVSAVGIKAERKVEARAEAAGTEIKAEMSGTVVRVLVNEGEEVEAGQPVLVLEAMKMENEIPAPVSGRVAKLAVSEGDKVAAGQLLLVIEPSGSAGSGSSEGKGSKNNPVNPENPENGREVKVEMAGTIVRILKKAGESVKAGEPIVVLEAMKMENEIVSPADGVVEFLIEEGDKVAAGQVIAFVR